MYVCIRMYYAHARQLYKIQSFASKPLVCRKSLAIWCQVLPSIVCRLSRSPCLLLESVLLLLYTNFIFLYLLFLNMLSWHRHQQIVSADFVHKLCNDSLHSLIYVYFYINTIYIYIYIQYHNNIYTTDVRTPPEYTK